MAVEADFLAFALALLAVGPIAARTALNGIRTLQARYLAAAEARKRRSDFRQSSALGRPRAPRPSGIRGPVHGPPDLQKLGPGQPLELSRLDPTRRYLWVVDEAGDFRVCAEGQGRFYPARPPIPRGRPGAGETAAKHGDLVPGQGGAYRGPARAGGELDAEIANGRPTGRWVMNNDSSYTFMREDLQHLSGRSLEAAGDLLKMNGTDMSRIVIRNTAGIDAPR